MSDQDARKCRLKVRVVASGCGCRVNINDLVFVGKTCRTTNSDFLKGEAARGRGCSVVICCKSTGGKTTILTQKCQFS